MAKTQSIHTGHRERLRERFRTEGLDGFSEHEVLELLLTYAVPRRDVNPIAHALIAQFGSLAAVLNADESELLRVDGVGGQTAFLLTLMPALLRRYQLCAMGERPVIDNLSSAKHCVEALFLGSSEERVYMLCLDQGGHLIHPALLCKGTLDRATLYPRDVVETALRYHAYAVLLAHNHPGGIPHPSQADYDATAMVITALNAIGVRVVDHLVFSGTSVYSMAQNGPGALGAEGVGKDDAGCAVRSSVLPGSPRVLSDKGNKNARTWGALTVEGLQGGGDAP